VQHKIRQDGNITILEITGQLTSKDRGAFIGLLPTLLSNGGSVCVDMKNLAYMDSVGLGMMITLRDEAEKKGITASISNPSGDVKDLLEMACFDRLFSIS